MAVLNLTPHSIEVYAPEQYYNLEQVNATTWVADGLVVDENPLAHYPSQGVARIETETLELYYSNLPGETVKTYYGAATGIPMHSPSDVLIVSLPTLSMAHASNHASKDQMVSPYKVVRSRANGSFVLGCMGFSY